MINVDSSNISAIGYEDGTLRVRFTDGSEYDYYGVLQNVFQDFLQSDSKGTFLHQNIKGRYQYAKL
jgi:hypothetical protein